MNLKNQPTARLWQSGVTSIEYAIIASLIAVALIGGMTSIGAALPVPLQKAGAALTGLVSPSASKGDDASGKDPTEKPKKSNPSCGNSGGNAATC